MENLADKSPRSSDVGDLSLAVADLSPTAGAARPRWSWRRLYLDRIQWSSAIQQRVLLGVELLTIALWTLVITRPYLNLDPDAAPIGREYLSAIQTHHVWTRA